MASKVQKHMIAVAAKVGNIPLCCKLALMASQEGGGYVYLPNALGLVEEVGITAHQFAGGLSALAAKGEYKPTNDYFGRLIQEQQ